MTGIMLSSVVPVKVEAILVSRDQEENASAAVNVIDDGRLLGERHLVGKDIRENDDLEGLQVPGFSRHLR